MILASVVLTFSGQTGTYSQPRPATDGAQVCCTLAIEATYDLGAEAWGSGLLSSYYGNNTRIWVGYTLSSGGQRVLNGRVLGTLHLAGSFAPAFDGVLDFGGASGQSAQVVSYGSSYGCVDAAMCGPDITLRTTDYMISTTGYGYTFQPGTIGEAHLTISTNQRWNAMVEVN